MARARLQLLRGHAAGCGARRACSTLPPSRSSALAATAAAHQVTALQVSRAAERRRFGVPVWQLLGAGFVGTCAVGAFWYSRTPARRKVARGVALTVDEPVVEAAQAEALMDEVRSVLERRGLSLGDVAIEVKLFGGHARAIEGLTVKAATAAPPPRDRKVTEVRLQRGLPALHAAQVLAHEFMHAWMWLQGFPPLEPALEEGLCELASYLYLLSCLKEPLETGTLRRDEAHLRAQIRSIEANAHPDYGGGFRACAAALRHMPREGGQLHQLLGYVRQHGVLPPEARARVKTSSGA